MAGDLEQLTTALTGRYQVERRIGAGGMAVVYLARDLKHKRNVAVKVLNSDLAAVIGSERFLGEIQVTANLHHPHLLPLFDSGEADGMLYYVMPYIEGETLRQRLARERQLSVEDALRITTAIGSALDYAHRQGVIHRDLKPENVLMHDGEPLVMDFGIALAVSQAGGTRITQSGISLGTPHYMSPEQATGSEHIDARSDLYSLGAMLYEMLTGDPPHTGSTIQSVIAKVLTDRPTSLRAARDSVPAQVDAAVQRALAKLPADRFASVAEFTAALTTPGTGAVAVPAGVEGALPAWRRLTVPIRIALGGTGLVAAALIGYVATPAGGATAAPHPAQFAVALPDSATIPPVSRAVAVSRDGNWLAMIGSRTGAGGQLFLRPMAEMLMQPVRGTELAQSPSFSPDGAHVLFTVGSRLLKVPTQGGNVLPVADSASAQASWGDRDEIAFARQGTIWVVPANGGTPRLVARPDSAGGVVALGWPTVLPGGSDALVTIWRGAVRNDSAYIGVVSIDKGAVRELGRKGVSPRFALANLVYADAEGQLWAAPYTPGKGSLGGAPVLIASGVAVDSTGGADVSVSATGLLVYSERGTGTARRTRGGGRPASALVLLDSTGAVTEVSPQRQPFFMPRVSPDGRRIAVAAGRGLAGTLDGSIWVYDIASRALSRLTQNEEVTRPEWDAGGQRLAYRPMQWQGTSFVSQPWDRSGSPEPIPGTESSIAMAWGSAGRYLAVNRRSDTNDDVWIVPRDAPMRAVPVDTTAARELLPRLSPNERWVAYASNESGTFQVYVRPVPGPGARVQVSVADGDQPAWSRDGRTLYYIEAGKLMAARIAETPGFAVTRRDSMFTAGGETARFRLEPTILSYDVFPGGGFVFLSTAGIATQNRENVIAMVDWARRVRQPR